MYFKYLFFTKQNKTREDHNTGYPKPFKAVNDLVWTFAETKEKL